MLDCETELGAALWDTDSQTPYRTYLDGATPRQLYCENARSLSAKIDLVEEYDLGGAMFWALSYVATDHSVWADVRERFAKTPTSDRHRDEALFACIAAPVTHPMLVVFLVVARLMRRRRRGPPR